MPTGRLMAVMFLFPLVLFAGCVGRMQKPAADAAAITAAIDSLDRIANDANAAKDTAAMAATYADDAHVLPANQPRVDGKESIRRLWAETYRTPGLALSITPGPRYLAQSGDLAVDVGAYDFKALGPDGKPLHDIGKYVTVFRRDKAGWKVVVDTWNSDLPATAAK